MKRSTSRSFACMRAHPYHTNRTQPPSRIDCFAGPSSLSTSQTESISRSRRPPWLLALPSSFLADGLSFVLCVSTGWSAGWHGFCMSGPRFRRLRRAGKLLGYLRNCYQVLSMRRECVVLWEMDTAIIVRRMCQREGSIRACAECGMSDAVWAASIKRCCSGEVGFSFPSPDNPQTSFYCTHTHFLPCSRTGFACFITLFSLAPERSNSPLSKRQNDHDSHAVLDRGRCSLRHWR